MSLDRRSIVAGIAGIAVSMPWPSRAAVPAALTIDFATYNPLSLLIKDKGWLESALPDTRVRWVQSLGSNKALEFLNGGSIDFGSSAGAAALLARVNGNPIKSIYLYSRPEWTALVTGKDTGIKSVADLKGRYVAATRGTDPHIFLIRALATAGLSERDIEFVPLQHADGRAALLRGDVQAWSGLDPMMAAAELNDGAVLFYRNPAYNSGGILNVREAFAAEHADTVRLVLSTYEKARAYARAHPDELKKSLAATARLPAPVIERQLQRTDLSTGAIDATQKETVLAAGKALQAAGILKRDADVAGVAAKLIDTSFLPAASPH